MKLLLTFTGAIAALIGSKSAFAEYTLNMTKGITDISQDIYWLHMMAFWVCVCNRCCGFRCDVLFNHCSQKI
jgi:cytochrome c oxidase subunit 2